MTVATQACSILLDKPSRSLHAPENRVGQCSCVGSIGPGKARGSRIGTGRIQDLANIYEEVDKCPDEGLTRGSLLHTGQSVPCPIDSLKHDEPVRIGIRTGFCCEEKVFALVVFNKKSLNRHLYLSTPSPLYSSIGLAVMNHQHDVLTTQ